VRRRHRDPGRRAVVRAGPDRARRAVRRGGPAARRRSLAPRRRAVRRPRHRAGRLGLRTRQRNGDLRGRARATGRRRRVRAVPRGGQPMTRSRGRVGVGLYVDPVAPLPGVAAGIRLAQALRADDVWLGDHTRALLHESVWDPASNPLAGLVPDLDAYLDPTAVIARYAGRLGPRIGTSVTDAIRRTPADLARAWLTLHHVTGGRAVLGIGSGEIENTVPYGQSTARSVTRLDDTLAAIRAAWESEGKPLTHHGPFHHWEHATFAVPPRRGTFPPIWVAAQGPNACRAA